VPLTLERNCNAVEIPSGRQITLFEGQQVVLVQTLGGSFTIQSDQGYMARVAGTDAAALGLDEPGPPEQVIDEVPAENGKFDLEEVIEELRTVFDPEIPINVVDLGLVYACDDLPLADGTHRVEIKMSMTAPGCGMGDVLAEDARARVLALAGVSEVDVELVWDPPWDMSRMTEAARLELGMW
jgi:probable FeS assembly SUF system protein SufT